MAKPIGYIYGTAIAPGVSVNRRLYTRDQIRGAVKEAQARIAAGHMAARDLDSVKTDPHPLSSKTHHDAEDDSEKLAGRVDELTYEESTGRAKYKLAVPNTPAGRTMLELADTEDGAPFIRGMSIRGRWVGETKRVIADDGQPAETADGLQLVGLDFTSNPGVRQALIDRVERVGSTSSRESTRDPSLIYESAPEAPVTITEVAADTAKPTETVTFADPGYLTDGKPRLPVDTREGLRHAWETVREASLDTTYTDRQKRRIRERVGKAATKLGYDVTPGGWLISAPVAESEVWPDRPGSYCVSVDNGMVSISVSSYQVDPADLEVCARAAMEGACAALAAIDPDMDGDVDTEARPDDNAMESAHPAELAEQAPLTSPSADIPSAATATQKETGMAESTTPAAGVPAESATVQAPVETAPETVAEPMLSLGQVKDLFASFAAAMTPQPSAAPAESAPAAPVAEAAPVVQVQESADEKIARLVAEGIKAALPAAVQEHVEANGVQRKGLVVEAAAPAQPEAGDEYPAAWPRENGIPKAAHLLTGEEWKGVRSVLPGAVIAGARGRR